VEAAARDGMGVTATLRAAVAKILDNVKNNVDTTLYEAPELSAPDMSARSGVAQHSAGTPKLSMRSEPVAAPAPPIPQPLPPPVHTPAPFAAPVFESAFHATVIENEPEEDPFNVAVAIAEPDEDSASDNPFASAVAEIHDTSAERDELEALLVGARAVVQTLEQALEAARAQERAIAARLR
jgi:hypothetical protein